MITYTHHLSHIDIYKQITSLVCLNSYLKLRGVSERLPTEKWPHDYDNVNWYMTYLNIILIHKRIIIVIIVL